MNESLIPISNEANNSLNEPSVIEGNKVISRRRMVEKALEYTIAVAVPIVAANLLTPFFLKRSPGQLGTRFPEELVDSLTKVTESTYKYQTQDNLGHTMDTLKILPVKDGYIGAYHYERIPGSNIFDLALATSEDLINWKFKTLLIDYDRQKINAGSHATMPDLVELPNNGYLLAYEKDNNELVPKSFTWMELRYYENLEALLEARSKISRRIPHTLSNDAEGTTRIDLVQMEQDIEQSLIRLSFHYNNQNHVDEQGFGLLKNFSEWTSSTDTKINKIFRDRDFKGNIGGRDIVDKNRNRLQEAQKYAFNFGEWRPYLIDQALNNFLPLEIQTHKGSLSSGNHKSSIMTGPSGKMIRVNSYYIFSENSKKGEAGQLIFYREIEKRRLRLF